MCLAPLQNRLWTCRLHIHVDLLSCGNCNCPTVQLLMQKCDTNNFCKRNRGQKTSYSVDPKSLKVVGAELSAAITNTAAKQSFSFKLRAYGPVIRIMVDELPGDHVPRYQVPDILEPSLDHRSTPWQSPESTAKKWTGQVGDVSVHVTFSNFQIEVLVGKTPVAVFNSRSLFNMEHPRKKQVGVAGAARQAGVASAVA